jgi:branched-chain amino acid transport system ATP-binding protein
VIRRWYPVAALGLLAAVDSFHFYAFLILGPDIGRTLGVGRDALAGTALVALLAVPLGALALIALARRSRRRALLSVSSGALWSAGTALTSIVTGPWGLVGIITADGASTASVRTLHPALIADIYPAAVRVRALAAHRAGDAVGLVVGPLLVTALSTAGGLTWRGVFLVLAGISLVAVVAAVGLRDPGPERAPSTVIVPTTSEQCRALLRVPTVRRLLATHAVAGLMLAPLLSQAFFLFEQRHGLDAGDRGVMLAIAGAASIVAVALVATPAERRLARGPAALLALAPWLFCLQAGALVAMALLPTAAGAIVALAAVIACMAVIGTIMLAVLVTIVAPVARPHVAALAGIALAGIGGFTGLILFMGIDERLGLAGSTAVLAAPPLGAALIARLARRDADADHGSMLAQETEAEELARRREAGEPCPLLECRGLSHAYEGRPALERVDLTVPAGDVVALLGTNGAGKSTLLKLIAGLEPGAPGSVRLDGEDVALLDPERRARMGIVLVTGGDGTFGTLTVRESLRLAAAAAGRERADAAEAMGEALERFPALAARLDVRAIALSGGERQMLELAQALMLRPRLLLADELTRGLAPEAAADLLRRVRGLADAGMTVLLVDQSADTALSLASRALFMERGRIVFDGPPEALRRRGDLMRAVFLGPAKSEVSS